MPELRYIRPDNPGITQIIGSDEEAGIIYVGSEQSAVQNKFVEDLNSTCRESFSGWPSDTDPTKFVVVSVIGQTLYNKWQLEFQELVRKGFFKKSEWLKFKHAKLNTREYQKLRAVPS